MISIKCDKCGKDILEMDRIYNIGFFERELSNISLNVSDIYGLNGAVKKNIYIHVCKNCFDEAMKHIYIFKEGE